VIEFVIFQDIAFIKASQDLQVVNGVLEATGLGKKVKTWKGYNIVFEGTKLSVLA